MKYMHLGALFGVYVDAITAHLAVRWQRLLLPIQNGHGLLSRHRCAGGDPGFSGLQGDGFPPARE
jgi:hypothetical protein